jgi:hypothetical protein
MHTTLRPGVPLRRLAASEALARHAVASARAEHPDLMQARRARRGHAGADSRFGRHAGSRYITRGIG